MHLQYSCKSVSKQVGNSAWELIRRAMEAMEDLAAVAERREEPRIPRDQFLADIRKDRGEAGIFV